MTDLQDMLEAARKRVDAMTREEREKMWEEQRASWVRAMTICDAIDAAIRAEAEGKQT